MPMNGAQAAMIEAHRNNIERYARLLATGLTETERAYIHRRMAEEHRAVEGLMIPETDTSAAVPAAV